MAVRSVMVSFQMDSAIFNTVFGSAVVLGFMGLFFAGNRAQDINHIQIRRRWPNAKRRLIKAEMAKNWKYTAGPLIAFCSSPFFIGGFFSKFQGWEAASAIAFAIAAAIALAGVAIRGWASMEIFVAHPQRGEGDR
jgi:hypothetical protein